MADDAVDVVDLRGLGAGGGKRPVPECPIIALGQNDGTYLFISPSGEKRQFAARELRSDAGQISLFDGDTAFLKAKWPRRDRDANIIDDFNAKHAHAGLVQMCAAAGMWDPETAVRGRGVWRGPEDRLIYHSGDRLLMEVGGKSSDGPAGMKIGGAIYPARPRIAPPAAEPAPASAAKEWKAAFGWWRFSPLGLGGVHADRGPDGLAGELLFDVTVLAMLGAAPRWRVHALIKAIHGGGKSTLLSFIRAALGPLALTMNNFSEAGLRNSLANEARPVLLDEAEGDDGGTMTAVIKLIRQMSGNEGAQGVRGDGGSGGTRHFDIAGSAMLFCINPPVLMPQDLSRFVLLDMLKAIPAHERRAYEAIDAAAAASAGLQARAFYGWERFRRNLPLVRAALIAIGCDGRQADKIGGLLAAGAMMTDDAAIDAAIARDLAEGAMPLIETMRAEEADNSDAVRCWLTLVTRRCDVWRGGEAQTVGSLLRSAQIASGAEARSALNDYCGLRVELGSGAKSMPEAPCLYIARQHQFLKETYRDTPWHDGGWNHSLPALAGASSSREAVRVGGMKQRASAVPLAHLPRAGDDEGDV